MAYHLKKTPLLIASIFLLSGCHAHSKQTKQLVNQSLADMQLIKGGSYLMGPSNPDWQAGNDATPHKVTLSSFYISKYNVSFGKYDSFTQITDRPYIEPKDRTKKWAFWRQANHPVDAATWYQAHDYCHWLAKTTGLPYSLPTEAQWEYVARARGQQNWPFATNNGKQELGQNFPDDTMFVAQKYNGGGALLPLPIGSIPCTPQGICGMNGQVDQWMKDWYSADYYAHSPVNNPQGPSTGTERVYRGGSAADDVGYNNVYNRYHVHPDKDYAGLRCVINSDQPMSALKAIANKHLPGLDKAGLLRTKPLPAHHDVILPTRASENAHTQACLTAYEKQPIIATRKLCCAKGVNVFGDCGSYPIIYQSNKKSGSVYKLKTLCINTGQDGSHPSKYNAYTITFTCHDLQSETYKYVPSLGWIEENGNE